MVKAANTGETPREESSPDGIVSKFEVRANAVPVLFFALRLIVTMYFYKSTCVVICGSANSARTKPGPLPLRRTLKVAAVSALSRAAKVVVGVTIVKEGGPATCDSSLFAID